jgi:hypothetical protein
MEPGTLLSPAYQDVEVWGYPDPTAINDEFVGTLEQDDVVIFLGGTTVPSSGWTYLHVLSPVGPGWVLDANMKVVTSGES